MGESITINLPMVKLYYIKTHSLQRLQHSGATKRCNE